MKAFLLAAGFGTRLRPLTDNTPKCLVPIQGKPLLEWWLLLLKKHGINEVLINTHYLAEQVQDFVTRYNEKHNDMKITVFYEPVLLGSGGTVRANKDFIGNNSNFLICYADNLTNINLSNLISSHKKNKSILTMALFRSENPEQCGIAVLDDNNKIVDFVEKPSNPVSDLANAGVYVANNEIFKFFPDNSFCDFGNDILPKLIGQMSGYETNDFLLDIGTPKNYEKAQKEWKNDNYKNTSEN